MTETMFPVGTLLVNSLRQYTKVIAVKDGRYGLSGWGAKEPAMKATVARVFVNSYGLKYAGARAVEGSQPESAAPAQEESDTTNTPSKAELKKLKAEQVTELCEKLGLSTDGKKSDMLERLFTHYGV